MIEEYQEKYPEMRKFREMNKHGPFDESNEPNRVFGFMRTGNHFLMESIIYNFKDTGYFRKHHDPFDQLVKKYPDFDISKYKIVIQPVRHPIDVAISLFATPWHEYKKFKEFLVDEFVERYSHHYYSWKPIDIYRIKYEDLDTNHEETMERIGKHFNLEKKFSKIIRIPRFVGHRPNRTIENRHDIQESEKKYIVDNLKDILKELDYMEDIDV